MTSATDEDTWERRDAVLGLSDVVMERHRWIPVVSGDGLTSTADHPEPNLNPNMILITILTTRFRSEDYVCTISEPQNPNSKAGSSRTSGTYLAQAACQ